MVVVLVGGGGGGGAQGWGGGGESCGAGFWPACPSSRNTQHVPHSFAFKVASLECRVFGNRKKTGAVSAGAKETPCVYAGWRETSMDAC